jgi:signal transduction histidine kinase
MIIYLTAVTAILLLLSFFIITLIRRSQLKQLHFIKSINELTALHQLSLQESQMEIQEQLSREISNEIHDNISMNLSVCKMQLVSLNFRKPADMVEKLKASVELISLTMSALNHISKSLNVDFISNYGLANAIQNELKQLETSGMFLLDFQVTGPSASLGNPNEFILFRIIRESLHNILKHANATAIEIKLNYKESYLECSIKDNGIGFNPEMPSAGCGLNNMKKRALMLDAALHISSVAGSGTQIKIILPLPKP